MLVNDNKGMVIAESCRSFSSLLSLINTYCHHHTFILKMEHSIIPLLSQKGHTDSIAACEQHRNARYVVLILSAAHQHIHRILFSTKKAPVMEKETMTCIP